MTMRLWQKMPREGQRVEGSDRSYIFRWVVRKGLSVEMA